MPSLVNYDLHFSAKLMRPKFAYIAHLSIISKHAMCFCSLKSVKATYFSGIHILAELALNHTLICLTAMDFNRE